MVFTVPLYSPNKVSTIEPLGLIKKNPVVMVTKTNTIGIAATIILKANKGMLHTSKAMATKIIRYPLEGLKVFSWFIVLILADYVTMTSI